MAYGLEIYDALGNTLVTTNQSGFTLVDVFTAGSGGSYYRYYPEWAGHTIYAYAQPLSHQGGHYTSVTGTTVYVSPSNLPSPPLAVSNAPSTIFVFVR